jgi:hypothetical protein
MSKMIIEFLNDTIKQVLTAQVSHLDNGSKSEHFSDDERARFKAMVDGANTLLNILHSTSLGGEGTTTFLNHLNREQLLFAIEEAQRLLKQQTDQGNVKLFGVYTSQGNQWHTESARAKQAFVEAAQAEIAEGRRYPKVEMDSMLVPIEELGAYLGDTEAKAFLEAHPEKIIKPEK